MGAAETIFVLIIATLFLSLFGGGFVAVVVSLFPRAPGPRLLGVCWRLSQQHRLSAGGLRFLVVMATILTGIVPGIVAYMAFALLNSPADEWTAVRQPRHDGPSADTQLLGVCRDLADRLGVPAARVRGLFVVATVFTGIFPGIVAYLAAGILKALGPEKWREWFGDASRASAPVSPAWQGAVVTPGRIGRYRILGLLGRGGMGSVWRGRDDALGRDAAVKVIDGPFAAEAIRRFGEEARAAAALASPHIVQIWEYAPEARPPFLAMEYVPGKSLFQLVRSGGPQPVATVLDCARQVLAGLATAHAAGIVHRDIKPANILLATTGPSAGTFKLTDFGLACSADRDQSLTATGTLLGTLSYLAPEVALGDDATPSSDLYALGATLHEMLTGRPPLSAESPLKLLRRITTESIPPIGTLRPDLPADLSAWLDRLVARDRADRFPSADAALAALGGVEGARQATTDLERARRARHDDAVPWHLRPAPGAPHRLPPVLPADRVPDVLGRAMAFEADGRDPLGEDSILDIARELNVDTGAVRAAIEESRRGRGGGVTQVFRHALGGAERGAHAPDRSRSDIVTKDWIPGRPGTDRIWRATIVTACVSAVIAGLLGMTLFGVRQVRTVRAHDANAPRVVESIRESLDSMPFDMRPAEVPPAPTVSPQPAESPEPTPIVPGASPLPMTRAATPADTPREGGLGRLTVLPLVILLVGFAAVAIPRNRRRRLTRAAGRKWP